MNLTALSMVVLLAYIGGYLLFFPLHFKKLIEESSNRKLRILGIWFVLLALIIAIASIVSRIILTRALESAALP